MFEQETGGRVVTQTSIQDYFQQAVHSAMQQLDVRANAETEHYLVNLMCLFARSERLYERTPDGVVMKPLADLYAEAVHAPTAQARYQALRRLGDVALFVAGVFSNSLARRSVDVDYYVSMGGSAYGCLSESPGPDPAGQTFSEIFAELAEKFVPFADVLAEAGERARHDDKDLLRLYELWVRTGSRRAERRLREAGLQPSLACVSRRHH